LERDFSRNSLSAVKARKEISVRTLYTDLQDVLEAASQATDSDIAVLPVLMDEMEDDEEYVTRKQAPKGSRRRSSTQSKKRKIIEVEEEDPEDDSNDDNIDADVGNTNISFKVAPNGSVNEYYEDVDGDIESYILSPDEQSKRWVLLIYSGYVEFNLCLQCRHLGKNVSHFCGRTGCTTCGQVG
jgi:hypothetical protein